MGGDGGVQSETSAQQITANGQAAERGEPWQAPGRDGLSAQFAELAFLFAAIVGAVALGLGISDYLTDHPYVLGYLLAYAGFRIADILLRADPGTIPDRDAPVQRWRNELPILLLFVAAPFERTYIYGGEAPEGVAALGLLMELAGLWLIIGSRIQLRFGAGRDGHAMVRSGFYRYIRHPAHAGMFLMLFAWPFEYGTPVVAAITFVILLVVTARRVRAEEAEMLSRFGDEYESYMRETDRIIPNMW